MTTKNSGGSPDPPAPSPLLRMMSCMIKANVLKNKDLFKVN